jgi:transmembrane sensor
MNEHGSERVRQLGEASQWLVRLRAEPHSEDTVAAWLRWCEQDPENASAFERVQRLWGQMDQVSAQIAESMAIATDRPSPVKSRRFLPRWRIAAMLVCALGAGTAWFALHSRALNAHLNTSVPENRVASLPDGSSINLAAKTSVAVDFGGAERRIRMSSGEAYFKVRPDKSRPFVVRASFPWRRSRPTAAGCPTPPGA